MIRLISRGRFTQDYTKGLIAAPEDREPAVRKLVESTGGKFINFYFTTGEYDFVLIAEANDAETLIAAFLAAGAAGTMNLIGRVGYESASFCAKARNELQRSARAKAARNNVRMESPFVIATG